MHPRFKLATKNLFDGLADTQPGVVEPEAQSRRGGEFFIKISDRRCTWSVRNLARACVPVRVTLRDDVS